MNGEGRMYATHPAFDSLSLWKGCFDMADLTRNLSPNTVAFACLEPQTAILIVDVVQSLVSVLRWRQVSQSLLIAILSRLAEAPSFELGHAEFSAALWPHLKDSAREEKFVKWLTKLKEDIALSNCPAIRVGQPRRERHGDGSFKSLPTLYLPGVFWELFRAVQDAAMQCDLLSLDVRPRRAKVRAIVAKWLHEAGAVPIERTTKQDDAKPAKPSPPCKCNCINCTQCKAKANESIALASEQRVDKQTFETQVERLEELTVETGQMGVNIGLKLSIVDAKIGTASTAGRVRLRDGVARSKGYSQPSDTAVNVKGRTGLEMAVEGLRAAQAAARELGDEKYAAFLGQAIEKFSIARTKVFGSKTISMNGGQVR